MRSKFLVLIACLHLAAGCAPLSRGSKKKIAEQESEAPVRASAPEPKAEEEPDPREALPEGDPTAEGAVTIAAGDFWMGDDSGLRSHSPKRKITLDGFEIDRYEVTAGEYNDCVSKKKCTAARSGGFCNGGDSSRRPINCVTWSQAKSYCESLGRRLPTEAEWERAARGTDGRTYSWGENYPPPKKSGNFSDSSARKVRPWVNGIENYDDTFPETAPTGSFTATSPDGAADMAGNVMEWTADYWTDKITKTPAKNPKGPTSGEGRVVRGSSYGHYRPEELSTTYRSGYHQDVTSEHLGFRCAK